MDERVKNRPRRRLSVEDPDVDEWYCRHVRRIRHDPRAARANTLVKRRVGNHAASLGYILYPRSLQDVAGEKGPQFAFDGLRQRVTERVVMITLLLHPCYGFTNQSRQFRGGEFPSFHEHFPCGAY